MEKTVRCYICGAQVPDIDGPICKHGYMPQSPGCWRLYTEVLAREYGEWSYPDIHRLTVDCYAASHPTKKPNQKSAQSVAVHLAAIYLALEKKMTSKVITKLMNGIVERNKGEFEWLEPPDDFGEITVVDVYRAKDLEEHVTIVNAWAKCVWGAWINKYNFFEKIVKEYVEEVGG